MNAPAPKEVRESAEAISTERLITLTQLETEAGFVARYTTDEGLRCFGQKLIKHGDGSVGILILPDGRIPEDREAQFILHPHLKDIEEITATVKLIYSCPIEATLTAQREIIHADLTRLLDFDSASGAECNQFTINYVAPEAETYGNIEPRKLAERQTTRMHNALGQLYDEQDADPQELLKSALCDLRHFADQHGLSHGLVDKSAFAIYRAEKDADDTAEEG